MLTSKDDYTIRCTVILCFVTYCFITLIMTIDTLQIRVGRFDSGPRLQFTALSSFELRAVFLDENRFGSLNFGLNPTQGKRLVHR